MQTKNITEKKGSCYISNSDGSETGWSKQAGNKVVKLDYAFVVSASKLKQLLDEYTFLGRSYKKQIYFDHDSLEDFIADIKSRAEDKDTDKRVVYFLKKTPDFYRFNYSSKIIKQEKS